MPGVTQGRKRKPTNLHVLAGNPGKRNIDDRIEAELNVKPCGVVPAPAHLTSGARAHWDRLILMMEQTGILTLADLETFERYCTLRDQFDVAAKQAAQTGPVQSFDVFDSSGKFQGTKERMSIGTSVLLKLSPELRKIEEMFGMTPAARSKVTPVKGDPENKDPFA